MSITLNQEFICVDSGVIFEVKKIEKNKKETIIHYQSIWSDEEKDFIPIQVFESKMNNGEFAILPY